VLLVCLTTEIVIKNESSKILIAKLVVV